MHGGARAGQTARFRATRSLRGLCLARGMHFAGCLHGSDAECVDVGEALGVAYLGVFELQHNCPTCGFCDCQAIDSRMWMKKRL